MHGLKKGNKSVMIEPDVKSIRFVLFTKTFLKKEDYL
jgi:hypothetical protein